MAPTETVVEIERKYDGPGEPPPVAELLGVSVPAQEHLLEAVYYDTVDLRLLADGVTLRRRSGGHDAGWHLKLPTGADRRDEVRRPLTRERTHPPAELTGLVRGHSRGARLVPVAELRTRRRAWTLRSESGEVEVEVVADEVSGRTLPPAGSGEAVRWREVEVELGPAGSPVVQERIEHRLVAKGWHRSSAPSKVARLWGDRADAPPGPGRGTTAGEIVLDHLRRQARVLRAMDAQVRLDRPDAVHQMRVAARRTRSVLQAFGEIVDRAETRTLTGELAWIAGELAPARDTEVVAAHLRGQLAGLPADLVTGPVSEAMTRTFAERRAAAQARAVAALDDDRWLAVVTALDALLDTPPLTVRGRRPGGREVLRAVRRAHRRLAAAMRRAQSEPAGARRDALLHEARKAAKRLRYAVEVAASVRPGPARHVGRLLARVQDVLGAQQDTAVVRAWLRELGSSPSEDGVGFTYGILYAAEVDRSRRAQDELPRLWARLQGSRHLAALLR